MCDAISVVNGLDVYVRVIQLNERVKSLCHVVYLSMFDTVFRYFLVAVLIQSAHLCAWDVCEGNVMVTLTTTRHTCTKEVNIDESFQMPESFKGGHQ